MGRDAAIEFQKIVRGTIASDAEEPSIIESEAGALRVRPLTQRNRLGLVKKLRADGGLFRGTPDENVDDCAGAKLEQRYPTCAARDHLRERFHDIDI